MSCSQIHSLQAELVNSSYAELVRVVNLVPRFMDKRDDVTQLVPSDDGDYVYALTAKLVNYVAIHNVDVVSQCLTLLIYLGKKKIVLVLILLPKSAP